MLLSALSMHVLHGPHSQNGGVIYIRSHTSSLAFSLRASQLGSYTAHVGDYSIQKFNLRALINN